LELSPRADFFFWHRYPKADDAAIADVKKACSETGVKLLTLVPVFNWSSPDEQERQAQVRNWKRLLQIAAELECPVVNRATPGCLAGPGWSSAAWTALAAATGLEVQPLVQRAFAGGTLVNRPAPPERRVVHVICDQVLGDVPRDFQDAARAVAKAAGCDLLRVAFVAKVRSPVFVDADPFVDLSERAVALAVAERLAPEGRR